MWKRFVCLFAILLVSSAAAAVPPAGPQLTVQLGDLEWTFTGTGAPVDIEWQNGALISFSWSGDASYYGGTIFGYRYGWDLADPGDPLDPGWTTAGLEPDLLQSAPIFFMEGQHVLSILVEDTGGLDTLATFNLTLVPHVPVDDVSWSRLQALYRR